MLHSGRAPCLPRIHNVGKRSLHWWITRMLSQNERIHSFVDMINGLGVSGINYLNNSFVCGGWTAILGRIPTRTSPERRPEKYYSGPVLSVGLASFHRTGLFRIFKRMREVLKCLWPAGDASHRGLCTVAPLPQSQRNAGVSSELARLLQRKWSWKGTFARKI